MMPGELNELIDRIVDGKAETQTIELKAAVHGCPKKLYDTLSAFSNQDDGGIIIFGIDEEAGFAEAGVYDAHDLQKHVAEQCQQMDPPVRAVFTIAERNGKYFVSAEIPGIDAADRPCFYKGSGRLQGSYIRVGDADERMTEYEIYTYEAFRKKLHDETRILDTDLSVIDEAALDGYLVLLKKDKPNLQRQDTDQIKQIMDLVKDGKPTMLTALLFGIYPQALFPQLSIIATVVPGENMGETGSSGERFTDNKRIEGTLPQMINEAVAFVMRNMKQQTLIHETDKGVVREDIYEYPVTAVREAIINSAIHRDYSIHTENMPISLTMYSDRLIIENPGGLYGRISIDNIGKTRPDTRNPRIAVAMEVLGMTENRYSGIPTMYRELKNAGLPAPEFKNERGFFSVCFRKRIETDAQPNNIEKKIISFCSEYRTKEEIAAYLGLASSGYVNSRYILPLVESGKLKTEKPGIRSHNQRYISNIKIT